MVRMYQRYRDKGVAFVSVSVTWDTQPDAKRFAERYHLPYPVGFDVSGAVGGAYGVDATPTTVYIDRNGIIGARQDGERGEAEIVQQIDKLLTEK